MAEIRLPAEHKYEKELAALAADDTGPRPPGWALTPRAAETYIMGRDKPVGGVAITPKYVGDRSLVQVAIATLASDRALLLTGEPGTAKSWLSEHLAAYFFRRIGEDAPEAVLRDLMRRIAADEVRHAQAASDLIEKRLRRDPALAPRVLDAATRFRHYGARMVGDVPVAMPGDAVAIRTFAARVERLCGIRLVDHLKAAL